MGFEKITIKYKEKKYTKSFTCISQYTFKY